MNPATVRASRANKHPTAEDFATRKLWLLVASDNPLLLRWERLAKEIRA